MLGNGLELACNGGLMGENIIKKRLMPFALILKRIPALASVAN